MTRKTKLILIICLPLLGILAGYILMAREVSLTVNGETRPITTRALTVRGALRSAGYELTDLDRVEPPASSWLSNVGSITLIRSRAVRVYNDATRELFELHTSSLLPLEMLAATGIIPSAGDEVRVNGLTVPLDQPLPEAGALTLQYIPAAWFDLNKDGDNATFSTTAASLGLALWQQGVRVHGGDQMNQSFSAALDPSSPVLVKSAVPLIITADGRDIRTYITAPTVGEALALAGVSLQDLDYSRPSEDEPLPADGRIFVVRVREVVLTDQNAIPYSTSSVTDETLALDESRVITPGEFGLEETRVRVRYEDGVEVSRVTEASVMVKEPIDEVVAYGSSVDVKTIDTPYGTLQYYRAMDVTVTSYSPCNSGTGTCYPYAKSGALVTHGVLAVHSDWYYQLQGSSIYIPGYGIGTVEDTGSYPYNHNWIDLGYSDEEYPSAPLKYKGSITVYFLMPIPSGGVPILP